MNGVTLDTGGLIALDRKDRRVLALIARASEMGGRITIPATALAQAIRSPATQALLSRVIRQPNSDIVPLDAREATHVGLLLARTKTSDIVDAHVVVCAQRADQVVITTDADDLRQLSSKVRVLSI